MWYAWRDQCQKMNGSQKFIELNNNHKTGLLHLHSKYSVKSVHPSLCYIKNIYISGCCPSLFYFCYKKAVAVVSGSKVMQWWREWVATKRELVVVHAMCIRSSGIKLKSVVTYHKYQSPFCPHTLHACSNNKHNNNKVRHYMCQKWSVFLKNGHAVEQKHKGPGVNKNTVIIAFLVLLL